ncbi:MAG: hypothetical protein LBB34_01300 [Holosporales bacterium]|jgi:hypothetical protein|nr:hypothetical protein [Holosporales bacterium]
MNFSKYVLGCACVGIVVNSVYAAPSSEDPEIRRLKDVIEEIEGRIDSLKNIDDETKDQVAQVEERLKNKDAEIEEHLKNETAELEKKVEEISATATENSEKIGNETKSQLGQIEKLMKNEAVELGKKVEDISATVMENRKKIEQIGQPGDNAAVKNSIEGLNRRLAEHEEAIKQQNLEAAKNTARLDKIEAQNRQSSSSSLTNLAGGLLGSAMESGMNLLSSKLNVGSVKEQVASGNSLAASSPDLTLEEQQELNAIEEAVKNGASDAEIQIRLEEVNKKIGKRREAAFPKYQQVTLYGLNEVFKDKTIIYTLISQARYGIKIDPKFIVQGGEPNEADIALIDTIYEMAKSGATVPEILDNVKLIFGGSPKIVVKPTDDSVINGTPFQPQTKQATTGQNAMAAQLPYGVQRMNLNGGQMSQLQNQGANNQITVPQGNQGISQFGQQVQMAPGMPAIYGNLQSTGATNMSQRQGLSQSQPGVTNVTQNMQSGTTTQQQNPMLPGQMMMQGGQNGILGTHAGPAQLTGGNTPFPNANSMQGINGITNQNQGVFNQQPGAGNQQQTILPQQNVGDRTQSNLGMVAANSQPGDLMNQGQINNGYATTAMQIAPNAPSSTMPQNLMTGMPNNTQMAYSKGSNDMMGRQFGGITTQPNQQASNLGIAGNGQGSINTQVVNGGVQFGANLQRTQQFQVANAGAPITTMNTMATTMQPAIGGMNAPAQQTTMQNALQQVPNGQNIGSISGQNQATVNTMATTIQPAIGRMNAPAQQTTMQNALQQIPNGQNIGNIPGQNQLAFQQGINYAPALQQGTQAVTNSPLALRQNASLMQQQVPDMQLGTQTAVQSGFRANRGNRQHRFGQGNQPGLATPNQIVQYGNNQQMTTTEINGNLNQQSALNVGTHNNWGNSIGQQIIQNPTKQLRAEKMIVMNIKDNKFYIVETDNFLKIAHLLSNFPEETNVNAVNVTPIDQASRERLEMLKQ